MIGILFAILTAFLWALSVVLVRRNIEQSNFFTITVVFTLIGGVFYLPWAIFIFFRNPINIFGILAFILAGILHPGLARPFYFKSMEEVGVSSTAAIISMYPIISTLIAILVLGEHLTISILIGIICIIFGTILIQGGTATKSGVRFTWRKLLFPLSVVMVNGFAYVFKKVGLNLYNEPVEGVFIGYITALCFYSILSVFSSKLKDHLYSSKQEFKIFWKAGAVNSIGWLFSFFALKHGDVVIVVPLIQTQPLFVFLLVFLFLKGIESLSTKLVLGGISIILGVVLIISF